MFINERTIYNYVFLKVLFQIILINFVYLYLSYFENKYGCFELENHLLNEI